MAIVNLKGAGGVEQTFDLPLPEVFKDQLDRGFLQPSASKDEKALAEAYAEPVVEEADEPEVEADPEPDASADEA